MKNIFFKIIVSFTLVLAIVSTGFDMKIVKAQNNEDIHIHIESPSQNENIIIPSCTEDGSHDEVVYCRECGEVIYSEHVVDKSLGHDFDYASKIVYSTCTEDGYKLDICKTCGYEQKRYSPSDLASGHIFENGICWRCGEIDPDFTEEIHVHYGDSFVTENVIAPSCTEDGSHDEVIYCAECGEEIEREKIIDKSGHDFRYAAKIVYSTCTEDGYKLDICNRCGYIQKRYSIVDLASGHLYENGVCWRCGEKDPNFTEEVHVHNGDSFVTENVIAPSCSDDGSHDEVVYCSECGEVIYSEHVVDKSLGHDFDYASKIVYSTCTEDGYKLDICKTCGYEQKRYSPSDLASGHIYENGICFHCGEKDPNFSEEVHMHSCDSSVIENMITPTCTDDGSHDEVMYCNECGEELSRNHVTDKADGHHYIDGKCVNCNELDPNYSNPHSANNKFTILISAIKKVIQAVLRNLPRFW